MLYAGLLLLMSAILAPAAAIFCTGQCGSSGIRCANTTSYQVCVNMTDYAVGATDPKPCPDGTVCTTEGSFPCITAPITATSAAIGPPTCTGSANFSGPAPNQYYTCAFAWFQWQPYLNTCPDDQNFDETLSQCVTPSTTTTAPTTVGPPQCSGDGNFPGPAPNQYYVCKFAWFRYQPYLVTCPDGQIFDETSSECATPPTAATTTTTTTNAPPTTVGPPRCTGEGNFTGPAPDQYYTCAFAWFQWQPYLNTCPDGQLFDKTISQCAAPPTTTTTTTTTTSAPPTTVGPPRCTGDGNFPGPAPDQYYTCAFAWFQWQPYLNTCPDGQLFNKTISQCA